MEQMMFDSSPCNGLLTNLDTFVNATSIIEDSGYYNSTFSKWIPMIEVFSQDNLKINRILSTDKPFTFTFSKIKSNNLSYYKGSPLNSFLSVFSRHRYLMEMLQYTVNGDITRFNAGSGIITDNYGNILVLFCVSEEIALNIIKGNFTSINKPGDLKIFIDNSFYSKKYEKLFKIFESSFLSDLISKNFEVSIVQDINHNEEIFKWGMQEVFEILKEDEKVNDMENVQGIIDEFLSSLS